VKKTSATIKELAALDALGALTAADSDAWTALLAHDPQARTAAHRMAEVAENLARSLPPATPSAGLKARILQAAESEKARRMALEHLNRLAPASHAGLAFLREANGPGWLPLPVAGASVKLLSFDPASAYAVVLGKLEPGARYPGHRHIHPEDIFMLSGDLHVGDDLIRAGDFHHADAGSEHGVNWSEEGCVLLCVLSREDLLAQLVRAAPGNE
jgi:anti-sigma factor ChrR (cupin superfamily)